MQNPIKEIPSKKPHSVDKDWLILQKKFGPMLTGIFGSTSKVNLEDMVRIES